MAHVVVIGSGIAGLTVALRASAVHEVTLVTKDALGDGNTARAQGGIAGVLFDDDSVADHVADTVRAGAGLSHNAAVDVLCTEGPERIRDLAAAGVNFDSDGDGFAQGLEAAHSFPRIVHAGGDATGRAISRTLAQRVRDRRIRVLENTLLVDIVTASGVAVGVDLLTQTGMTRMPADTTIIATGGCGQLYARTTNPLGATGDGVAAALRAGARIADAEFYQFHPTALAGSGFLVSEAVRGAGAVLLDDDGRRFMPAIDPRAELAPRSIVSLALSRTMARSGGRPVRLDATAVPSLEKRFPTISAAVAQAGFDWTREPIPVTPAAHYWMGGIATDLDGRTSIDGLFAVGEAAHTGVHGANRLASNSLLEGAVFAERAAAAIDGVARGRALSDGEPARDSIRVPRIERGELQRLAWAGLGIERDAARLTEAIARLDDWDADAADATPTRADLETRNLLLVARVIAHQALARQESRGAHERLDFPDTDPEKAHSISTDITHLEALAC